MIGFVGGTVTQLPPKVLDMIKGEREDVAPLLRPPWLVIHGSLSLAELLCLGSEGGSL